MTPSSRARYSICISLALFLLFACDRPPEDIGVPDEPAAKTLPRSTPEAEGVSSADMLTFFEEVDRLNQLAFDGDPRDETGFHSVMVLRNGRVIAEGWWTPYESNRKHRLYSLSKSFTSTAVGLAIKEGFFTLDDPVVSFFPEQLPEEVSDNLAAMTVRNLLTMSTGQEGEHRQSDDWAKEFLAIPIEHAPGSVFRYNTSATFMLSAIVQNTTGQTLMEFLTPRFFEPLGIEGAVWLTSPKGYNTGGYGLSVKTEDIAKLGQFYLQKGMWNGERILSEEWVEQATSNQIASAADVSEEAARTNDWVQGYGYQFWQTTHHAFRGDGAFGQYSIVIPELNAVIAATAGSTNMQRMLNLIWAHLYPSFKDAPLPADDEAQAALKEKLASLTLLPARRPEPPALAREVSAKPFKVEENDLAVEEVVLGFEDDKCSLSLKSSEREDVISCGFDDWVEGAAEGFFLPGGWQASDTPAALPVAASGRWTDPQTFQLTLRFVESPDYFVFTASFGDGGIELKRNGFGMFGGGAEIVLRSPRGS